jgi:hypothetical protein
MTPVIVRRSAPGRLAAFLLIVLIASPFTAPFSAMSGGLDALPCGAADSVNETAQADAIVEVAFVHTEPSWSVVISRALAPTAVVQFARVNRILRL